MTSRDFCYWLQGYFEVSGASSLTPGQVDSIKSHLDMVFAHEIDPSFPEEQTQLLDSLHQGSNGPNTVRC